MKMVSNPTADGRIHVSVPFTHLPGYHGCMVKVQRTEADQTTRYLPGGILTHHNAAAGSVGLKSLVNGRTYPFKRDECKFWVLPRT